MTGRQPANRSRSPLLPVAAFIAAVFFAKFAAYAWLVTPLWKIPDEPGHYSYALDISRGEWPLLGEAKFDAEVMRSWSTPEAQPAPNWIAQHPPLFYALDAPIVWATRSAGMGFEHQVRSARLLSALFGGLTVLGLALFLARATGRDELGLTGAIFLAATPTFTHLSTGVTHDVLVACTATWAAYWCGLWLQSNRFRDLLYAGALVAACTVTKITGLAMAVPLFLAMAWQLWRVRPPAGSWQWLRRTCALWLVTFGPVCLWIARNLVHFGQMFPDAANIHNPDMVPIGLIDFMSRHPVWEHTLLNFVALVGWNGWIQADGMVAQYFLAYLGIGACGAVLAPLLSRATPRERDLAMTGMVMALVLAMFQWPVLRMVERTCLLLLVSFAFTAAINVRGALRGDPERWLLATAAACTLVFALLYLEHLRNSYTGAMRATHGRYFYPVLPFVLFVLLRPFRGPVVRRLLLCAAAIAMLVADSFFLRQVFDMYGQLPP